MHEVRAMTRDDEPRLNSICKRRASHPEYEEENEISSPGQAKLIPEGW